VASARDVRQETKRTSETSKRKGNSKLSKSTSEEKRSTSMSKGDGKKSKNDRVSSANPRRAATATAADSTKGSATTAREKKMAMGTVAHPPKRTSTTSHDEKHDKTEKAIVVPLKVPDRTNPLLTAFAPPEKKGEIHLRGNFILLSLNLSRNYLSLKTVEEFLLSIQHQTMEIQLHSTPTTTTTNPLPEFSGLCRLELKGMNDIPVKSSTYQSLEMLLQTKNPSFRFQQYRERENKAASEQHIETTGAPITTTPTPLLTERSRRASHSRAAAKHKDPI